MLSIKNLVVGYGKIVAVKGVSLDVSEGAIVAIIGANGAGKTTLLKAIAGIIKPVSGIIIDQNGQEIQTLSSQKRVASGIVLIPERRGILGTMTVLENLQLGAFTRSDDRRKIHEDLEGMFHRFPILRERRTQLGINLSGGQQQMLTIARGLMAKPRILLMDEPSLGLSPMLVEQVFDIIQEINAKGTTIMLVEQNAKKALSIASYGYALELGQFVLEGPCSDLINNPKLKAAYLGEEV